LFFFARRHQDAPEMVLNMIVAATQGTHHHKKPHGSGGSRL